MTKQSWDEVLRSQQHHLDHIWQDEISRPITEGNQLCHLGLHHWRCKKRRRADDRLQDLQLVGGGTFESSPRCRAIRAWQLIVFRRFLRLLLHPVDRLEVYNPPLFPSYFHRLPTKTQKKLGPFRLQREHPLGLSRSPYEAFRIWPGVLVMSKTEIDRAIDDERRRLVRKCLRAKGPRNAIGYRSKKWRPQHTPVRPQRPRRDG